MSTCDPMLFQFSSQWPVGFDSIAYRAQDKDFNRIENWKFMEIVWGFLENLSEGNYIKQLGKKNIPWKLRGREDPVPAKETVEMQWLSSKERQKR